MECVDVEFVAVVCAEVWEEVFGVDLLEAEEWTRPRGFLAYGMKVLGNEEVDLVLWGMLFCGCWGRLYTAPSTVRRVIVVHGSGGVLMLLSGLETEQEMA